ncbi:ComEC/Rec2 family competence protein [Tetragenococcus muriaticus]|uniref:ComEC/Rec2 family competence protein n=1 Tax=Tetragenococcus muriaticus TaxID=64642 RepID=UPI000A4FC963
MILLRENHPKGQKQRLLQSQEITLLAAPLLMYMFFEIPLLGGLLTALSIPLFSQFILPLLVTTCFLKIIGLSENILEMLLEKVIMVFEQLLHLTQNFVLTTGQPPLILTIFSLIAGIYIYQNWRRRWLFLPTFFLLSFNYYL